MERVKWQVSRKSAEDKVQDFLKWMKAITGIVHHQVSFRAVLLYIRCCSTRVHDMQNLFTFPCSEYPERPLVYTGVLVRTVGAVQHTFQWQIMSSHLTLFCNIVVHHTLPCNMLIRVYISFVQGICSCFSDIWHWSYIFLTIVLNILVLIAWKDPADVTPEDEM